MENLPAISFEKKGIFDFAKQMASQSKKMSIIKPYWDASTNDDAIKNNPNLVNDLKNEINEILARTSQTANEEKKITSLLSELNKFQRIVYFVDLRTELRPSYENPDILKDVQILTLLNTFDGTMFEMSQRLAIIAFEKMIADSISKNYNLSSIDILIEFKGKKKNKKGGFSSDVFDVRPA